MTNPAAWHPDPTGRHEHRYWDGERWTEHVADAGQARLDPLDAGPAGDPATAGGSERDTPGRDTGWAGDTGTAAGTAGAGGAATGDTGAGWQQPDTSPTYGQQPTYQQQPAAPGWQQSTYGNQAGWGEPAGVGMRTGAAPGNDGIAITALIIGILSLLTSWILIGGLGGIIAIVLGFIALSRIKRSGQNGRGMAITGIVTGVLSIIVAGLVIVFFGYFFSSSGGFGFFDDYMACIEEGNSEAFCDAQLEEGLLDRFGG